MSDKTLDERCAEVYALDVKRTQGEWLMTGTFVQAQESFHCKGHLRNKAGYSNASYSERICEIYGVVSSPIDELDPTIPAENMRFIAAATKMPALIRDLQARVKELEKNLEWQPIETAPKDSTDVLLFGKQFHNSGLKKFIGHWASDLSGEEQPPFEGWFYLISHGEYSSCWEAPTHWMPLPEPPHE